MPIVITSSRRRPRRGAPGKRALTVAAAAVLAIAAGVAWFLLRGKPGEMQNAQGTMQSGGRDGARPSRDNAERIMRIGGRDDARPTRATMQNGGALGESAPPEAAGTEPGPPEQAKEETKKQESEPGRRLRHGSEQLLAMIISTDETGVPPLPISPEDEESLRRDLLAAITNDIVIFDDEDAKTQDVKERVADAKRQLADILQKGGSVVEAIREYEAHVNEGAKLRSEVIAKIAPEVDAIEDDAKALEYVESVNEALKKEDIPPIKPEEVGFEKTENE